MKRRQGEGAVLFSARKTKKKNYSTTKEDSLPLIQAEVKNPHGAHLENILTLLQITGEEGLFCWAIRSCKKSKYLDK